MRLEQPPLLHDGGYWYVVPVVFDAEDGYAPDIEVSDWCAWYAADYSSCVIRTPLPIAGLKTIAPSSDIPMLRGRVRGV